MSSRFFYTNQNSNVHLEYLLRMILRLVKVDNPDLKDREFLSSDSSEGDIMENQPAHCTIQGYFEYLGFDRDLTVLEAF